MRLTLALIFNNENSHAFLSDVDFLPKMILECEPVATKTLVLVFIAISAKP